jgi:hypothetical protein
MSAKRQVPRRRGASGDGQSWSGVLTTCLGAVLGALTSLGALFVGLYALAYADHGFVFGGYTHGCEDPGCSTAYLTVAAICFGSIVVFGILAVLALLTSIRMLRAGMRLGLAWAGVVLAMTLLLTIADDWLWLGLIALPPALMGWGSRWRLRAKEARLGRRGSV